jgi:acetoin utilization protein AcuB
MIAQELISTELIPLFPSDSGQEALDTMSDFYIKHLPIVENGQLLGILSEEDVLNNDVEEGIGTYELSLPKITVKGSDHIFDVMRVLVEHQLTTVPVVDKNGQYMGLIYQEDLLHEFAKTESFAEPGAIIVLEVHKRNYSLSEIARIVESEHAIILNASVTSQPESDFMEITIKINRFEIQRIVATFERYKYEIKATFSLTDDYKDALQERYDALMSYLNV